MSSLDDAARCELIAQAYDSELMRQAGRLIIDQLSDHLQVLHNAEGAVHHWNEPQENISLAAEALAEVERCDPSQSTADRSDDMPSGINSTRDQLLARLEHLLAQSLSRGQNLQHRRYIGHQVPAPVPLAGLFDAAMAVTNQVQGVYEMGPWAVSVERAVIDRLGQVIGFTPGQFSGLVTSGGSLANLTALLTARNLRLPNSWSGGMDNSSSPSQLPVLVTNVEAHYCVDRAAGVLGLGTDQVVRVGADAQRRMDPRQLDLALRQCRESRRSVVAVVAVAGATATGAYDPLDEIADVCQEHDVWLHVDAAHGGAACFSDRHRALVSGLHRADSVVLDAHKMMFMPAVCAMVFYKNPDHRFATFEQSAPYLFDPSAPGMAEYDNAMVTVECTKRAASVGLWAVWSLFGDTLFEALVDTVFQTARILHDLLERATDFTPFCQPTANIVVFRFEPPSPGSASPEKIDALQLAIRRHVLQSGDLYLTQTKMDGRVYLRCTIMNPLTSETDLHKALESLRAAGQELYPPILDGK